MMDATGLSGAGKPDVVVDVGACDALIGVQAIAKLARRRARGREVYISLKIGLLRVRAKDKFACDAFW
jgi:hypothetical protein